MRIAFLVLAHHLPRQLARLVRHLKRSGDVFVHIDRRATERFLGLDGCQVLDQEIDVWWGGWSIAKAQLALARAALPGCYDYYCLLSGQCYPIKPLASFRDYLSTNASAEHIRYVDVATRWPQGAVRFEKFYFERRTMINRVLNRLLLKFPHRRVLPGDLTPYTGSQWWSLTHDCLTYVEASFRLQPDLTNYFRYTRNACEIAFQTVIGNSEYASRVNLTPTHEIEFFEGACHPRLWAQADLPRLMASQAFFARKFDERRDARILDELDCLLQP